MNTSTASILFLLALALSGSLYTLYTSLKSDKQLAALIGLFCMGGGSFLLLLDLLLVILVHGIEHIPGYLLFDRLVSDSGFAGRWILTAYIFLFTAFIISLILSVLKIVQRLNPAKKNFKKEQGSTSGSSKEKVQ